MTTSTVSEATDNEFGRKMSRPISGVLAGDSIAERVSEKEEHFIAGRQVP